MRILCLLFGLGIVVAVLDQVLVHLTDLDMDLVLLIMDQDLDLVLEQDLCLAAHPEEVVIIKSIITRPEIKNKK